MKKMAFEGKRYFARQAGSINKPVAGLDKVERKNAVMEAKGHIEDAIALLEQAFPEKDAGMYYGCVRAQFINALRGMLDNTYATNLDDVIKLIIADKL